MNTPGHLPGGVLPPGSYPEDELPGKRATLRAFCHPSGLGSHPGRLGSHPGMSSSHPGWPGAGAGTSSEELTLITSDTLAE